MMSETPVTLLEAAEALNSPGLDRRAFVKAGGVSIAALGVLSAAGGAALATDSKSAVSPPEGANNFYKSDKVTVQKVTFKSSYSLQIVGNLVTPKNLDRNAKAPAIV
ncbi:hydrolases of the alpha/beta superfamily [Pseudomonas protegens Cab57]|nr:hydrolases of the alpha/beta superfamily [Pseudomonas protegens Cab57]